MKLILSICSLIILGFNTLSAQGNDEQLSAKLTPLLAQLDEYITTAPQEVKFQRVRQAQLWLDALNAFTSLGSLNINDPVSKLDETEQALLKELSSGVASFTTGKQGDLATQTQAIKNKMRVVKNQFQADNSQPYSYYLGQEGRGAITLYGHFPLLLKDTSEVYITNGTRKIGYSAATDTSITFSLAGDELGLANLSPLEVARLEIHLVGQVGRRVNKRKQFTSVYHIYAIALPPSPGTITVTHYSQSKNTEKQNKRTRTFLLNGSKGNLLEKQCVPGHDGWVVIPETVELVVESSTGQDKRDWNYRKTTTGGKICFTTEVFYNSSGPSGKLEYHLKYEIKRDITEEQTETSSIDLTWDMNKRLDFDLPIVSVSFTNFLDETVTVSGTSLQSPWMQLELEEKNIAIKTPNLISENLIP